MNRRRLACRSYRPPTARCAIGALAMWAVFVAQSVSAQVQVSPALSSNDDPAVAAEQQPRQIKVWAAVEPDPALSRRFWPAPEDRENTNPMPFVSRAILLQVQAMQFGNARTDFGEKHDQWHEMPISDLPRDEVRKFLDRWTPRPLGELERAENCMQIDYDLQLNALSTASLIQTLLPEYQEMRTLARMLSLRARLAAADERWEDFERDCRLNFRLSEVAAHSSDFLIGRLVGFAIAGVAMQDIQDAMQQPGCPSYYWAMATLPADHLFETRESIEFESVLISRMLDKSKLPDHPIGAEASRQIIRDLAKDAGEMFNAMGSDTQSSVVYQLMSGLYVVTMADTAREELENTETWAGRVSELSAPEAVLRMMHLTFTRLRDQWVKWSLLPPHLASEYRDQIKAAEAQPSSRVDVLQNLVLQLTPAVQAAARAGSRGLQQRNLLITIESLRLHASVYDELPQTLDRLQPVPAWHDSIGLKSFQYERTSQNTATLVRAARYDGDKETTFEIQLMTGDAK